MKSSKKEQILKKKIRELVKELKECKKLREELKKKKEYYRLLCDIVPVGIGIADMEGKVIYFNKAMSKIIGYPPGEAKELDIKKTYINPKIRKQILKIIKKKGYVHDFEVLLKRKSGEIYTALLDITKMRIGKQNFLVTIERDITKQKGIEEESQKRTEELKRFNKLAVGRELKMIELKKRIKELEAKLKR